MDLKQFKHEIKYSDLKKKMKEKIEKTKKNVEQLSYEYIDSSYKINLLQNSQLLTEIDHLKKEIQEIQTQKEKNDKLIFELNKDISTHQEVENQLALKNKNYLEIIKNLSSKLEGKPLETHFNKSHFNSSCENSIVSYNHLNTLKKENYISLSKSQVFRKNMNSLNHSLYLEKKMSKIEEELNHKKKDFDILRINYENLGCKYKEMESKMNNVVILLIEGLNRLSGTIGPNSIELNDIKNNRFQDLSSETKHSLLTQLINNFLPFFNDNIEKFTRYINYSPEISESKKQKTIVDTIKRIKSNSHLGVPMKLTLKSMNKFF
jgi:chromosome segregation ATPase